MFAAIVGSIIGSYVPVLFGADMLSFSSILGSGVGGVTAVVLVLKLM